MARPCNSSSADPEEQYRRLERLLAELYLVLRTLFAQGAPLVPPPQQHQPPQPPPSQDPSGSRQRRSRGGRSRCSRRPADADNHQNEPDDHSGGTCGNGQQNLRTYSLASRIVSQSEKPSEGSWDAIGLGLKHVADHLDQDFSKFSPNITGLFEVLTTLFATFFDVKSSSQHQRSKIRERQKT